MCLSGVDFMQYYSPVVAILFLLCMLSGFDNWCCASRSLLLLPKGRWHSDTEGLVTLPRGARHAQGRANSAAGGTVSIRRCDVTNDVNT